MNVEKRAKIITEWINNYCETQSYKPKSLIVGISGGIDSSVVSTLCANTGRKTIVLTMPIKQIKSQNDLSLVHAKYLKDKYSNLVEINKTFDNLCEVSSLQGNKLNSTKVLLDLLKLKGSDLFYFGDGEADIELLNYARFGFTVKGSIANSKLPNLNTIEAPEKSGFYNFINSIT